MRQRELVAILCGAGPSDGHDGCRVIRAGAHAAVLAAAPRRVPFARRQLLEAAAARARLLEGLMAYGPVLPALPGQRVGEADVPRLIEANLPTFARLEERLAGRAQYQVTVRWDADRALAHFGHAAGSRSAEGTAAALAATLHERIAAHLVSTGAEMLALPAAGDVISNHAILIERAAEAALDAALERIDAIWSEGFAVKVIGPYPAVSFASLAFERVDARAVRAARAALGLGPGFTDEALRLARRNALLAADPAARETLRAQAEALACAARLGDTDGPVLVARIWSEGMATPSAGEARAA